MTSTNEKSQSELGMSNKDIDGVLRTVNHAEADERHHGSESPPIYLKGVRFWLITVS